MTNYPWPMDKPIEEIESYSGYEQAKGRIPSWTHFDYLITRLKIAEQEREALQRSLSGMSVKMNLGKD